MHGPLQGLRRPQQQNNQDSCTICLESFWLLHWDSSLPMTIVSIRLKAQRLTCFLARVDNFDFLDASMTRDVFGTLTHTHTHSLALSYTQHPKAKNSSCRAQLHQLVCNKTLLSIHKKNYILIKKLKEQVNK